jgi:hypothetical protein
MWGQTGRSLLHGRLHQSACCTRVAQVLRREPPASRAAPLPQDDNAKSNSRSKSKEMSGRTGDGRDVHCFRGEVDPRRGLICMGCLRRGWKPRPFKALFSAPFGFAQGRLLKPCGSRSKSKIKIKVKINVKGGRTNASVPTRARSKSKSRSRAKSKASDRSVRPTRAKPTSTSTAALRPHSRYSSPMAG